MYFAFLITYDTILYAGLSLFYIYLFQALRLR